MRKHETISTKKFAFLIITLWSEKTRIPAYFTRLISMVNTGLVSPSVKSVKLIRSTCSLNALAKIRRKRHVKVNKLMYSVKIEADEKSTVVISWSAKKFELIVRCVHKMKFLSTNITVFICAIFQ